MKRITPTSVFCRGAIVLLVACLACRVSVSAFSQTDLGLSGQRAAANNGGQRRNPVALTANPPSGGDFGELTSALATLDQQWQIEQRKGPSPDKPRWSKLVLPNEESEENEDSPPPPPFPQQQESNKDFVWMLEPPNNSIPSCVVVFTGGAGLGQFPQVAYNELLSEVSKTLNAICLTAPYEVGLDHFSLAKSTGEKLRRALLVLEDTKLEGSRSLPKYSLAHSLGCKLQTIYLAATGLSESFAGVGFLAYNNFSFARTITMARSFAQELRGGTSMGNVNPEMINSLFDFAEMAVGAVGLEFSPTPQDTERLIQLRYNENLQQKTRVFRFGSDQLDSSDEFRSACGSFGSNDSEEEEQSNNNNNNSSNNDIDVSSLEGGHLTPVFFKWDANDLANDAMGGFADTVSQENLNMAKEAMGGFQGASFGDEVAFGALVDEICDWVLGKPPKQPTLPQIASNSSSSNDNA